MQVQPRSSSAVRSISTDLLRGRANVEFKNGSYHTYTGVSRRAILNLLTQPNLSLGFWVNTNCLGVA